MLDARALEKGGVAINDMAERIAGTPARWIIFESDVDGHLTIGCASSIVAVTGEGRRYG